MKINWNGKQRNLIGRNVYLLRKANHLTQKELSHKLQLSGCEINDLAILRIEKGTRFVSDIEVRVFADFFDVPIEDLFSDIPSCLISEGENE